MAMLSAGRSTPERNSVMVAMALGALLGTALLWVGLDWTPLRRIDASLASDAVTRFADPAALQVADHVTHLADAHRFLVLSVGVIALGMTLLRFREALGAAILLGGANVTTQLVQMSAARSEPHVLPGNVVVDQPFPSGHATSAASIAIALTLVLPTRLRPLGAALGCVFLAAQWLALMVVHTHMPSHLVGGLLVAIAWMALALRVLSAIDRRVGEGPGRSPADWQRHELVGIQALLAIGVVAATATAVLVPDYAETRDLFTAHAEFAAPAALAVGGLTLALAIVFYAASRAAHKRRSTTPG